MTRIRRFPQAVKRSILPMACWPGVAICTLIDY
jgi:hypothetical protein